jgi:hypothetical protein
MCPTSFDFMIIFKDTFYKTKYAIVVVRVKIVYELVLAGLVDFTKTTI